MELIELEERRVNPLTTGNSDAERDSSNTSTTTAQAQQEYPQGFRLVLLTIGLITSCFLSALDSTIVTTAIPAITTQFGTISHIAWYGSAYGCSQTAFQSAWGKAYKYFPLKPAFLLAIAIFEAGNIVCATARSSDVLVFGRVVAGLGGGGVMTGAFLMIALSVRERYRAAYMGILGVTYAMASVVGPLMGGMLTDHLGWRWCFWINLPIGGLATAIQAFAFRSPLPAREGTILGRIIHMDLFGGALVAGFLTCFVNAMQHGGTHSWNEPRVIGSLVGFCILFIAFVVNEWLMKDKAMVQTHLVRNKRIAANLLFIFFLAGLFFPLIYTLPVQYQSVDGASASQSGVRLIPLVCGVSAFTLLANGILTYWRNYRAFLVMGAFFGTAGTVCLYQMGAQPSAGTWIGYELLAATIGLALQIPMIANQVAVGADDIASVTAITLFVENAGTTIFVASSEAAFTKSLSESLMRSLSSIDPEAVLDAGATQIRHLFSGNELEKVLESYLEGSRVSRWVSIACGIACCLISGSGAGWVALQEGRKRWNKRAE
ncbi:MFS gliotoxin efflux transporter glia [Byssothecium circinans]|uniref:MFS gliotoxin efflux transporter glia n=1 Tax=Byssothecium circinans TaxID=147558 RepID=A0A6A5UDQ8_9PLEO|nr:MFS gliotoxin efflux transporter glia [Byssothecium circinans]